jgi:RHS repeat-associated protein
MLAMPHLPVMEWDYEDQLQSSQRQAVNNGPGERTYYVYDDGGQRVRKVTDRANGTRRRERIYLGDYELFREYAVDGETVVLERQTLHVTDGEQRIALVETKTIESSAPPFVPGPRLRFQLDNHLGSAVMELDSAGALITYEEYHPYGGTSLQAGSTAAEVSLKRYRYTGKERDEETGFYYNQARYYAPWLGRWTSCDPLGELASDEFWGNLYAYVDGRPTIANDPSGTQPAFPTPRTPHNPVAEERGRREIQRRIESGEIEAVDPQEVAWRNAAIAAATYAETAAIEAWYDEYKDDKSISRDELEDMRWAERDAIYQQSEALMDYRLEGDPEYQFHLKAAVAWYAIQTARGVDYALTADPKNPVEELQPEVLEAGGGPRLPRLRRPRRPVKGRDVGEYRKVGGHHVHAKAAFRGHSKYDPKQGFSISQKYMKRRGWNHGKMTAVQSREFRKLAKSGKPNSLRAHSNIARKALIAGGASKAEAAALVRESLMDLRSQMVKKPTRIPWAKK